MHWARLGTLGLLGAWLSGCTIEASPGFEDVSVSQKQLREAATGMEFGDPLPGLTPALIRRFERGRTLFSAILDSSDGLGYAYSGLPSCSICHSTPVTGGSSGIQQRRFGFLAPDGSFDPLLDEGGPSIQGSGVVGPRGHDCPAAPPSPLEDVPVDANVLAFRRSTPLFGLGLVEAIPDETLELLARSELRNRDGVRGRVNHVKDATTGRRRPGRFGLKSQVVTLTEFVSTALLNELGITTPLFPEENCPGGDCRFADCDGIPNPDMGAERVSRFVDYVRLLSPPPPRALTATARQGERLFQGIGCAACHVPTLVTGESSIAEIDRVAFHPYSDFLVHDMGPSNLGSADLTTQGQAPAQYVRTAPLWGANSIAELFHDGRGGDVPGAVFWHGGEAQVARDRFEALSSDEQAAVAEFVLSL